MVAASKLAAESGEEQPKPFVHPWFPDATEFLLPGAAVAAAIIFNQSSYGKQWYASLAAAYPDKERLARKLFFGIGGTVSEPSFWIPTIAFLALDFIQPKWLMRLRLQPAAPPPSAPHLLKTFLVSYVIQYYLIAYVQKRFTYPLWRSTVKEADFGVLPSALRTVLEFIACEFLGELIFYITHRAFHHRLIYKWVHKRHHENTAPFTLANLYSDPFDVILNNLPTTTLPPALIGAHPTSFWAYLGWRNLHGALVHCGYDVPGVPDIRYHDWHHRKFDGNYAINAGAYFLDRIFGTVSPGYGKWLEKWNAKDGEKGEDGAKSG